MRWLLATILILASTAANADDLMVYRLPGGACVAVRIGGGKMELVGLFDNVTVIESTPVVPPVTPTGTGQLICVRPWSCTLDESDADLTIRESIDSVASPVPYIRLLPGTLDQRMQSHPAERYRGLVADQSKAWIFHVVPAAGGATIAHQGPLNADVALGWIGVKRVAFAAAEQPLDPRWVDVDFSKQPAGPLGSIELPPLLQREALAAAQNVTTLPGFKPIPKSEWPAWVARFPVSRLAKSIRNTTKQTCSSCVGHACANEIEAGCYMMGGDWLFRRNSGMSMYKRIGRSSGSGAYIPDAADEIFSLGILPVTGEPYPHTFSQDSGWSTPMPSGWEDTGKLWKAVVYTVDSPEAGFRVGMDMRLGRQIGRSSHSICAGGYTGKSWWYENSWGDDWGDLGKSIGYDSNFYSGFVYQPVLRDEVDVLLARELPPEPRSMAFSSPLAEAAKTFHDKIQEIKRKAEAASKKE
jgi:hypothetical protein